MRSWIDHAGEVETRPTSSLTSSPPAWGCIRWRSRTQNSSASAPSCRSTGTEPCSSASASMSSYANPSKCTATTRRAPASRGRLHRDRGTRCRPAGPARLVASKHTAVVSRRLAAVATIFLPISFLAGFWGQNFDALTGSIEKGWTAFLVLGVGLSVACVAVIIFMLSRRGWK